MIQEYFSQGFQISTNSRRVDVISGGEPVLQNVSIICSPLLYLNFKSPMDSNSSLFIRFQLILHESGRLRVLKFLQFKEGWPNFWGEPILQNVWIIWSPLLYFNFKSFLDSNPSSFIRFQCILYDSGVLHSGFSNLYQLKSVDLISGGKPIFQNSGLFGPLFCI